MDDVPQEVSRSMAEFVANYHRAGEILEAVSAINRAWLRRREALSTVAMSPVPSAPAPIEAGWGGVLLAPRVEA